MALELELLAIDEEDADEANAARAFGDADEDEAEDDVGLPMGAPSAALIESRRFQVVVGEATAVACTTGSWGRLPPLHLPTVSSPMRCSVGPPLFTRTNEAWFCLAMLPCCPEASTPCRLSRATAVEVRKVACIAAVWLCV